MPKMIDLSGQHIENFLVLERDFEKQKEKNSKEIFWKCKCDCGTIFSTRGHDIRQGKIKSCGCLKKINTRNINFKDLSNQRFGKLVVQYEMPYKIDNHCIWHCVCDCGNEIDVMGKHLSSGVTSSCGCIKSTGELKVRQALEELQIIFETQKDFQDCINIMPLKFDFYLPERKIVIECQGKQHYEPVLIFGGEERFKQQQICDKIKKDWCKNNNIRLIEICYKDYQKINVDYINKILSE